MFRGISESIWRVH